MRMVLRRLLEEELGLVVLAEAETAEAALEDLPHLSPDLVLTDLSLPGASGLELVRALKFQRPGLPCLVVTGHVDPSYELAASAAGAAGFVTKDDPDRVLEVVRRLLGCAEG